MSRIQSLGAARLCVPLHEPFGIATGAQPAAENVIVRLTLDDGTVGIGEAAPVPHISGETQAAVLAGLRRLREVCVGWEVAHFRRVCAAAREILADVPSALCGFETALFDARARQLKMSLWEFFGGKQPTLDIDITITTGTVERAAELARRHAEDGFRMLKVKIGGVALDQDVSRVRAILQAAPESELVLDGNTAFSAADAVRLVGELSPFRQRIVLFEQPTAREDFEGLREVEEKTGIAVAADESLRGVEDFRRILEVGGISALNIKTAKLGLLLATDLMVAGQAAGLEIMVGGMVETEIAMGASAAMAAGVGGVRFADLDTPRFLTGSPVTTAIRPWGPRLELAATGAGHGASVAWERDEMDDEDDE